MKDEDGKLELMTSVHIYNVFMSGRPDSLEKIKVLIKLKYNIQESGKVNKFIGVYHEWGHDAKVLYVKMTMKNDVKNDRRP